MMDGVNSPDSAEEAQPAPTARPGSPSVDGAEPELGGRWRSLLSRRAGGAQVVVAVLLAALGFAAVVQVRLTRSDDDFSGARRSDLVQLLDSLSGASDRAQQQIDELQQVRGDLLDTSERRQTAIDEGRERLGTLQILAGTVGAIGPGITVTIQDPSSAVTAPILLNGINEMRDAGAEAMELNDSVRVVAATAVNDVDGAVVADGIRLDPPYVLDIIGSSHTLAEAVVFRGGLSDEVEKVGGSVSVTEADVVQVQSLHTPRAPEYSQPTNG